MKQKRDQRTILIVSLLVIVLIMVVGFAAFATNLTINGTANISTNWCVGFDNTKTTAYEITKGKSTGTNPSATMEYDGTACSTNYVPIANLGAVFYQPGDKVEYTLTIANKGSVDAAIESIKVNGSSVTSNQTITDGNIIWKVYMPESTTLSATTGTTTMKVSAEFQNKTDISNLTTGGSSSLTVGINVVQGTSGMAITSSEYTGSIYRWERKYARIGDSIVSVSETKWCAIAISNGSDNQRGCFDTETECNTFLSDNNYTDTCQQKTVTTGGIGEYTTDASTLNKDYYLKHDVEDNVITASYLCFNKDSNMVCLNDNYEDNVLTLNEVFNEEDCSTDEYGYECNYNNLSIRAFIPEKSSTGDTYARISSGYLVFCNITGIGSTCN